MPYDAVYQTVFLSRLWNNRYIDNVQIILSETVAVLERGGYYDHYGALRDMVQNHMLELMALLAWSLLNNLRVNIFARSE